MKKNKNILTVPRQKIQDTTLDLFEIIEERKKKVVEDIQWHKEYVDNKINKSLPHLREIDNKITEEAKQLLKSSNTNRDTFFGWVGGKAKIASEIITRAPKHDIYIELFTGSGVVFLKKQKANISVLNDINNNLTNLFITCWLEPVRLVKHTMYLIDNRFIFGLLKEKMSGYYFDSVFQRAAAYLYLINLSFNNEESYNYQTKPNFENKSWGSEIFGTIKIISDKMRNDVVVENLHFEDFIKKYRLLVPSNHNIFLYADPPYWVANKSTYYNYVFTEEDHILLAELMHKMPNNIKFIISYDDVPQIRELYKDMFIETTNQYGYSMNTGTGDNQIKKIELLISNFKLSNKQESFL